MALAWSWAMFGSAGLPYKDHNKVALASSPGVGRAAWPLWLCVSGWAEGVVLWAASVQRAWASGGSLVGAAEPGSQPRLAIALSAPPGGVQRLVSACLGLSPASRVWVVLPPLLASYSAASALAL